MTFPNRWVPWTNGSLQTDELNQWVLATRAVTSTESLSTLFGAEYESEYFFEAEYEYASKHSGQYSKYFTSTFQISIKFSIMIVFCILLQL